MNLAQLLYITVFYTYTSFNRSYYLQCFFSFFKKVSRNPHFRPRKDVFCPRACYLWSGLFSTRKRAQFRPERAPFSSASFFSLDLIGQRTGLQAELQTSPSFGWDEELIVSFLALGLSCVIGASRYSEEWLIHRLGPIGNQQWQSPTLPNSRRSETGR